MVVRLPFTLRRPWLLAKGTLTRRDAPDVARLRSIEDPDQFLWAMLPHAARSFAASVVFLPASQARVAATAYLYCRMLDSYEDLHPDPVVKRAALETIATRNGGTPLAGVPELPELPGHDQRERVHILLVERRTLIDQVFLSLSIQDRENVADLVAEMAAGMLWAADLFAVQGGVLETEAQLTRYCRHVIGEPALFALRLLQPDQVDAGHHDAMAVSEMIQLANVTRDIERDLDRGIGYHPALRPYLGRGCDPASREAVRRVREELLVLALQRAPAYRRLVARSGFAPVSRERAAAVAMLLFTDRYYRSCAVRVGRPSWRGSDRTASLILASALAGISPRYSDRVLRRIEGNFVTAAAIEKPAQPAEPRR